MGFPRTERAVEHWRDAARGGSSRKGLGSVGAWRWQAAEGLGRFKEHSQVSETRTSTPVDRRGSDFQSPGQGGAFPAH